MKLKCADGIKVSILFVAKAAHWLFGASLPYYEHAGSTLCSHCLGAQSVYHSAMRLAVSQVIAQLAAHHLLGEKPATEHRRTLTLATNATVLANATAV